MKQGHTWQDYELTLNSDMSYSLFDAAADTGGFITNGLWQVNSHGYWVDFENFTFTQGSKIGGWTWISRIRVENDVIQIVYNTDSGEYFEKQNTK